MKTYKNMDKVAYEVLRDMGFNNFGSENLILKVIPQSERELEVFLNAVHQYSIAITEENFRDVFIAIPGGIFDDDLSLEIVGDKWAWYTRFVPDYAGCNKEVVTSFIGELMKEDNYTWEEAVSLTLNGIVYSQRWGYYFQ